MFKRILIANRGEIAVRVATTARRLGVETVAVFSDADQFAPHVAACDDAVHIGPAPATESYLLIDRIIEAAKKSGAEAVHPGYGFLSENAEFADALDAAGLVFIGPTAETIRAMGSKSAAKDLMEAAKVPTTPGYQGEDQSLATFKKEAKRIGYPVLLKATAGGGGKGMRRVDQEKDLKTALESAQREAKSAFGDDRFLIEKFVTKARHVEVQIFGDGLGEVVHLYERDCSVQRRHQKVIEEAPAPNLPEKVRSELLSAGVNAGKAVNYRGAGTVEFLYDAENEAVYFMEMNTRLQVEHPVTEEITGVDLVEWQLSVAAGQGLPVHQDEIEASGHAFEARLYAEDPRKDFAPSVGKLTTLELPDAARVDSGVIEGQEVTPFYDPMIAKIITKGPDRTIALGRMRAALAETRVAELEANTAYLSKIAEHEAFAKGEVSTRFIDEFGEALLSQTIDQSLCLAVYAATRLAIMSASTAIGPSLSGFRLNRPARSVFWVQEDDGAALVRAEHSSGDLRIEIVTGAAASDLRKGNVDQAHAEYTANIIAADEGHATLNWAGQRIRAEVRHHSSGVRVFVGADYRDLILADPLSGEGGQNSAAGSLLAPMPGMVTLLCVEPGAEVQAGDALLVMEAMKMEHTIHAPEAGIVQAFKFEVGAQVKDGDLLVELISEQEEAA